MQVSIGVQAHTLPSASAAPAVPLSSARCCVQPGGPLPGDALGLLQALLFSLQVCDFAQHHSGAVIHAAAPPPPRPFPAVRERSHAVRAPRPTRVGAHGAMGAGQPRCSSWRGWELSAGGSTAAANVCAALCCPGWRRKRPGPGNRAAPRSARRGLSEIRTAAPVRARSGPPPRTKAVGARGSRRRAGRCCSLSGDLRAAAASPRRRSSVGAGKGRPGPPRRPPRVRAGGAGAEPWGGLRRPGREG